MPQSAAAQVLRRLALDRHPDLLVGTETFDDAGVFRLSDDLALVQTVDFFPPLVDDPYDFGRIAAANALSDVYAMGGEPLTALNIVGFPDNELDYDVLVEILRGGADIVRQSGAVIAGGHSVRDAEVKYGLAVTGRVHPRRILTNAAAQPGDVLVLTKPIGSGVLTTAAKRDAIQPADLAEAIEVMITLNRAARDAALEVGVNACTDITGFGLLGHAFEMATGSNVSIEIRAADVPLLGQALALAARGFTTRAANSTREHLGEQLEIVPGVDPVLVSALLDAQTSGGLLLAVPSTRADDLLRALHQRGVPAATRVGQAAKKVAGFSLRLV